MYGDAQAEKAGDGDLWNEGASIDPSLFTYENKDKLFFGGVKYRDIKKWELGFRLKSIFTT